MYKLWETQFYILKKKKKKEKGKEAGSHLILSKSMSFKKVQYQAQ